MHIVIIGNGISGISCARQVRKLSDHRITVISAESSHFFSRTALMYIYMGHMRFEDTKPYEDWFWEKNRIALETGRVIRIDPGQKSLVLADGRNLTYDKLLIASGSSYRSMDVPGVNLPGVQGLYSLQDLESMEENTKQVKHAVVVGGGLIGIEMAEMLSSRNIGVTMLVREESYWNSVLCKEESEMVNRQIRDHGVDLRLSSELREIKPGKDGRICGVVTKSGEEIASGFVGLTIGVQPNTGFLDGSGIETGKGVFVDRNMQTNIPDIYAAGDCAEFREPLPFRKSVEQVWYTGKMQGITAAYNICGREMEYQPGHWFNSAKFFDIEYQVYGNVPADIPANMDSIYWEHPDGRRSVRLVYEKAGGKFTGAVLMGMRGRHHIFQKFLEDGRDIHHVAGNMAAADFNSEFSEQITYHISEIHNSKFPDRPIHVNSKRGPAAFFNYLKSAAK